MNLRVANSGSDLTAGLKNYKPMQDLCTEENNKMKGYGREILLGIACLDGKCGNVEIDNEYVNKRWPTRVFYGEDGELKHPYTRMEKPNLNLMSCRYCCKLYRTFKCSARLDIVETKTTPGVDIKHGGASTVGSVRKKWH